MEAKYLEFIQNLPKGAFMRVGVRRPLKMKAGQPQIFKVYTTKCKPGIAYDNIAQVIQNRIEGVLPEENQGLFPNQSWHFFPYVIKSSQKFLYRFTVTGCNKPKVKFVDDKGNEFAKEVVQTMAYSSEFKPSNSPVFNITEDYITSIQNVDVDDIE